MPAVAKHTTTVATPTDRAVVMTRVFDAPRAMVFDAWTKPALLRRWFGPPGWTLAVCEIDLRAGGAWRYVMERGGGGSGDACTRIVLAGIFREVAAPERIVATQRMEGCEGQGETEALATAVFAEHAGRTTLTNTVVYESKDVRDRVLASGGGKMDVVYDRLDALLAAGDTQ